jgi:hypothetical protein
MNGLFTPRGRRIHPLWARTPPLVAAEGIGFPRQFAIFRPADPLIRLTSLRVVMATLSLRPRPIPNRRRNNDYRDQDQHDQSTANDYQVQ